MQLRMRLIAAAAAHALRRKREAHSLIEQTLAIAEQKRSAPILRDAYSLAARITHNAQFKSRAKEIARLLTA